MLLLTCLVLSATFSIYNSLLGSISQLNTTNSVVPLKTSVYYHFNPPISKLVASRGISVAIGDANDDDCNDIVALSYSGGLVTLYFWNQSLGDWLARSYEWVGRGPFDVVIGDANNDGYNDIITANSMDDNVSILIWNNITEDYNPQITKKVGALPFGVAVGDANNDGYNDIVTANVLGNNVSIILWNQGGKTWDKQITKWVGTEPEDVVIEDVNNDGYNDIVTPNYQTNTVSILLWNNVSDTWNSQITRSTGAGPSRVAIADANNDGYKDIVTANYDGSNVSIIVWNNNTGNWNTQLSRSVGYGPQSIVVNDANNDGYNDIITADYAGNTTSLLFWDNTTANWASAVMLNGTKMPSCAAVGDINNDSYNDIVISQYDDTSISLILWNPAPKTPVLDFYGAHPAHHLSADGIVRLNWTAVETVTKYYVYRDIKAIDYPEDIVNLTPIAAVITTFYIDFLTINDYYWYVVVAGNAIKNSSLSNCEIMHIIRPISAPNLSAPLKTGGGIYLTWTPVVTSNGYCFYTIHRDTKPITFNQSYIWTITIGFSQSTNFTDTLTEPGVYYYAIVDSDGHVYNISNNVSVEIESSIPGFEPFITLFALILIAFVFSTKKRVHFQFPNHFFSF